jgi:hypothetical protein
VALAFAAILFIGYLLLRAYKPEWFGITVSVKPKAVETFKPSPPIPTKVNTAAPPIPAPAPLQKADPLMEPRTVSPGGPGAPNAEAPDAPASISPDAAPLDPYQDGNMEAPIHDSMRHPELSFGPGVENSGINRLGMTGVGSTRVQAGESPFSPEFAQNGGSWMDSVSANDLTKDDRFANA